MFGNLHGSSPTVVASLSWNLPANISEEKQNIERVIILYVCQNITLSLFWLSIRIREVMELNVDIVDIDGSYFYGKEQRLISQGIHTVPLALPTTPLAGWESIDAINFKDKNVPKVSSSTNVCILKS